MGFELSPPPFLSLLDKKEGIYGNIIFLSKGVNFASGGSGILDETGRRKWVSLILTLNMLSQEYNQNKKRIYKVDTFTDIFS